MTSTEVAAFVGGTHHGSEVVLSGVGPLDAAGPTELAYAEDLVFGDAGVVLCRQAVEGRTCIVVEDPKLAFIRVLEVTVVPDPPLPGVHPTAVVEGELGVDVYVGPYAVIQADSTIGDGAVIHAHAVVGVGCHLGAGTTLYPHAVLYPHTWVGAGCTVHAGAVLGADGFSFHPTPEGPVKVPQVGRLVVHDGVEIGANSTVDRAFLRDTTLGAGTALDNLVHIGHNCQIGRQNLYAAQAGVSGSVITGDGVVLGGQAGIADHAELADGVQLAAKSAVHGRVETGTWFGIPAVEIGLGKRMVVGLRQLPDLLRQVRRLEARLAALEGRSSDGE